MKPTLILLAAGMSSRFSANKLFFEIDGKPMWRHIADTADAAREAFSEIILVSRYPQIEREAKRLRFTVMHNSRSEEGISAAVRLGVAAANPQTPLLFAACNQPYLSQETLRRFSARLDAGCPILSAAAKCGGVGNPVGFAPRLREELLALTGDTGGKQIVRKHHYEAYYLYIPKRELINLDMLPGEDGGEGGVKRL